MSIRRRVVGAGALAIMLLAGVSGSAEPASQAAARGELFLDNGDLVTANGRTDSLIRLREKTRQWLTMSVNLGTRLKPKGLDYDKYCEKVAIANSFNVVTYDVWSREIEVIEDARFGHINDVQYDMQCNLIIADMGFDAVGRWPKDGVVWTYSPEGHLGTLGGWRHEWVNPAFLDMDEWGTLFVLDKAAGPKIPGTRGQWHYDALFKLGPPGYKQPKARYKRKGIEASSFMAHPDGRFFFGNGPELLVLEHNTLRSYCPGAPFTRVNGLGLTPDLDMYAVDGYDLYGNSALVKIGDGCSSLDAVLTGPEINGSQGLTVGLPAR